jgi:O-antigen ligase
MPLGWQTKFRGKLNTLMPDSLKSLLVILVLAIAVFSFASRSACEVAMPRASFLRRRNLWIAITVAVFFANNFWVYIVAVAALLAYAVRKENNLLALYFFVLFAVPLLHKQIGGFGIVNFLFSIDYARLLTLVVLLPAFAILRKEAGYASLGFLIVDKLILGYLAIQFALIVHGGSVTNAVRLGLFYPFLGIFLPYFVASRLLRTFEGFREVMMAYVIAAMILSAIAFFEFLKHWLLYTQLELSLGVDWRFSKHLVRAGNLRALGSTGQPIALGFAITVGIGFMLYLRPFVSRRRDWILGMGLLSAGLLSSLSRGPWLGAVLLLLVFLMTGASPVKQLFKTAAIGILLFLLFLASPLGGKLQNYLPWIGTIEQETISYRSILLDRAIILFMKNPLFGARNFLADSSELEELAIGSGFIDIVNTYIRIALTYGLAGLVLFVGCFVSVIAGIIKTMRGFHNKDEEGYRLGQVLLSVLLSIAFMISTVSSISVIPWIYWSVIGMGGGYILMIRRIRQQEMRSVAYESLTPPVQTK